MIQKATISDLEAIKDFTDFWLAGRGLRVKAPGAVNDYFISPGQHKKYIEKYTTYLIKMDGHIIAWAVTQNDGSLIHLLVSGYWRNFGIGTKLLKFIKPEKIHSKLDQASGDPAEFYERAGYTKTKTIQSQSRLDIDKIKPDRPRNIDIFERVAKC